MKKKVVIASVLKAVDDVRMYEKFANSIIKHFPSEVEVHILGAKSNKPQAPNLKSQTIFFHPISDFDRLSKKRWAYSKIFLNKVLGLKPSLLIINSPELLLPALLIKIKIKIPIFYDVRENYWRNILYQPTYKSYLRPILAVAVRSLEYLSRLWIDFYLLAEKCYEKETSFGRGKSEIIENKYVSEGLGVRNEGLGVRNEGLGVRSKGFEISTSTLKPNPSPLNPPLFLYTGTISPTYGTINAIRFIKKIRKYLPDSHLLIKGFCSDKKYFQLLESEAKGFDFITLEISNFPINHQEIIATFTKASIALLPYLPNKSTENCIPAKMYESIAHNLPMIIQKNALWESVCSPCKAALFIDFEEENLENLASQIVNYPFYSKGDRSFVFWENTEEKKLVGLVGLYLRG